MVNLCAIAIIDMFMYTDMRIIHKFVCFIEQATSKIMKRLIILAAALVCIAAHGQEVLVEAESFAETGGWKIDQQFMDVMGSPYLIAHGAGCLSKRRGRR